MQARLYWRIIRDNLDQDEVYKDYPLENYRFIVVNKKTLVPLVWEFKATKAYGTLVFGKNDQFEVQDPFDLGDQLSNYLSSRPLVPSGIKLTEDNDIIEWLNKR